MRKFNRFLPMDEEFTCANDWRDRDLLMYHVIFGLSAGIPLCCVLYWVNAVVVKRKVNLAYKLRTGNNPETSQSFALCPKKVHY